MRACEGHGSLLSVYAACVYLATKASHRVVVRGQLSHMLSRLLRVPIKTEEVRGRGAAGAGFVSLTRVVL